MSEKKKRKRGFPGLFRKKKHRSDVQEEPVNGMMDSWEDEYDYYSEDLPEGAIRRQEKRDRKKNRRKRILMGLAILALFGIVISQSPICSIKEIKVHENNLFSDEHIISICGVSVGNRLYNTPGFMIAKNIKKANPYIVDVDVDKHFPNKLVITVEENDPVLALPVESEYIILDKSGKVVERTAAPTLATLVNGLEVKSYKIGGVPKVNDQQGLTEILEMVVEINEAGMYFKQVDMPSAMAVQAFVSDTLSFYGDPDDIKKNVDGLKTVLYDLSLGGHDAGVIFVGEDGYATYSPR